MAKSATTDKKYVKLVMVTQENNNKFYEMIYEGGSSFTVNYGRIELTSKTISKPYSEWQKVYNEKVNKGYKDVTDLVAVEITEDTSKDPKYKPIPIASVDKFITLMRQYTNELVSKTYSVKSDKVSEKQLQEAQKLLDSITKIDKKNDKLINDKLVELYSIIPRYMSHVREHILPNIDLDKALVQEQDNLDAISSQVLMLAKNSKTPAKDKKDDDKKQLQTFIEAMGVDIVEIADSEKADIKYILDQVKNHKVEKVFKVSKPAEDKWFTEWLDKQKDKSTRFLMHGTRCTSVVPILREGLKIRPAGNFQFSGKAYGDGNYFSEVAQKSLGYTGYDKDIVLLIYEVHTGNPFKYKGWYTGNSFPLTYAELSKRGFDSTYVAAGNGLLNSEIIAYKEVQSRIRYMIWLKR